MNKDLVNRRNSREWVRCNLDSRAASFRNKFVEEHGGEFVHNWDKHGGMWLWCENEYDAGIPKKPIYILTSKEGEEFVVDNVSKFCRDNELNKSALYEVLKGNRAHHKGFIMRRKEK